MDIDPRERLVDIYSEMRALDAVHYEYLCTLCNNGNLTTWLLWTFDNEFQVLIHEAQRLREALGLD